MLQVQQLGRTHRSNQVQPPKYLIVSSDISGEQRFASAVAKRLEQLGALTHGDRHASSASDALSSSNLQTKCGMRRQYPAPHAVRLVRANCSCVNADSPPSKLLNMPVSTGAAHDALGKTISPCACAGSPLSALPNRLPHARA